MNNKISIEYAEALFALAMEQGKQDEVYSELMLVNDALTQNPEYIALLTSPSITLEEKQGSLCAVFEKDVCQEVLSFLMLLVQRGRGAIIRECFVAFEELYNASKRTKVVTVISATELTQAQKQKIIAKLEKKYASSIILECQVDEGMLGGLIIKTDDTVIDGSLDKKLRDVKDVIGK